MNQNQFEEAYQEHWQEFGRLLDELESKDTAKKTSGISLTEFPARYRKICNHYSLSQARHYRPALVDKLHDLVLRGHLQLYRKKTNIFWSIVHFIAVDFPRTLRKKAFFFWLSCLFFCVPGLIAGLAAHNDPVLIYTIMDEHQVADMESMYNPGNEKIGRSFERTEEDDLTMFGFYILNNISIGFRTFSGGIVFGIGSIFFLFFNGVMLGGVAGHLSHPPFSTTFWQFVCGHGSFELTAIVICGAAGLLLGYSLLVPGRYRRRDALRMTAPVALKLVMGGALMLVVAAFIEAFWSSSGFSANVKFSVAAVLWSMVALYLFLAGRRSRES
ncbi:MAG: stage II sporulation protein M [Desulfocapsaceae bacterium]|nr:stage II sporulation protein M [Desulfocapsaceae bacterium]